MAILIFYRFLQALTATSNVLMIRIVSSLFRGSSCLTQVLYRTSEWFGVDKEIAWRLKPPLSVLGCG